jgi:hypothetical protein
MLLDNELFLSNAQAVTATGDTASTNVYDTGGSNGQNNLALTGENLWINVVVNTTATSGGSATVQAVLQDSADNSSWADVISGPAVAVASVVAGLTLLQIQPPLGTREYLRIAYRVGTAVLTAGKFDAYISNTIQKNVFRNSGFTS